MITWHDPQAFFGFIGVVGVVALYLWRRRNLHPSLQFTSLQVIQSIPKSLRMHLAWIPDFLKFVAVGFAILALARPQSVDTHIRRNVEGIDIMVVLDISDSMLIEDMMPENRLESSKAMIQKFIEGRSSDRIGLIIFSGESYTRVPLTLDYPLLLQSVRDIEITRNIKMGTAIGVALANAVARIKDSTAKTRVIIFLTDGENNTGTIDPITALEIAKGFKIRVYSIGMGKDGESQLPVYFEDSFGRKVKRYRPIHSDINVELLQRMADETGGKFWRATSGEALENAFREIDGLEKSKIEVNQFSKYTELFFPYLQVAILCYALALVLSRTVLRRNP
jgi:Ca-activated chloride channel family protein